MGGKRGNGHVVSPSHPDIPGHLGLQYSDEFRVHIAVVVRDVQDNQPRRLERRFEPERQFVPMDSFHAENHVGPFDQIGGYGGYGVIVRACRKRLDARIVREDGLCGGAAKFVLAAYKKEVQGGLACILFAMNSGIAPISGATSQSNSAISNSLKSSSVVLSCFFQ